MQEYFGDSAKKYKQPSDKFFTLFPGLDRLLPQAEPKHKLIDLGCGTADLFDFIEQKGYSYTGIDLSEDMLNQAKENHPSGKFIQSDVTKPISNLSSDFDVVFSCMLLPSLSTVNDFHGVFKTITQLLKPNGLVIIGTIHPCFDGYMQKRLFAREDIETYFKGYFVSSENYKVFRKLQGNDFVFSDHHWQLSDYFNASKENGLRIDSIDECQLTGDATEEIRSKFNFKGVPNYLVLSLKKI